MDSLVVMSERYVSKPRYPLVPVEPHAFPSANAIPFPGHVSHAILVARCFQDLIVAIVPCTRLAVQSQYDSNKSVSEKSSGSKEVT